MHLTLIAPDESFIVEDKKAHKQLGVYLGVGFAQEFFDYIQKQKLLQLARKIKESAKDEYDQMEASLDDTLQKNEDGIRVMLRV